MIEQSAVVLKCEGARAWVEVGRQSSCGSCAAKGCGTGSLSKVFGNKTITLEVDNRLGARVGDEVVIGIVEEALVKGSFLVYMLPLLMMFLGGMTGESIINATGELYSLLGAMVGLGLGFFVLNRINRNVKHDPNFRAVILRRSHASQGEFQSVKFIQPKT